MEKRKAKQSISNVLTPFRWDLLGFGISRAWFISLLAYAANEIWISGAPFNVQTILYTSAASIALIIAAISKVTLAQWPDKLNRIAAYSSAALGLAGMICIIMGKLDNQIVLFYIGLVFTGVSGGFFETVWGSKFTELSNSGIQVYTFFVMAVSSILGIAVSLLPVTGFYIASALLIGAVAFLYVAQPIGQQESTRKEQTENETLSETKMKSRRSLINILISCLMFSLIYNLVITLTYSSLPSDIASQIRFWANLIAALILLCSFLIMRPISAVILFRLILPITAVGFVLYLVSPTSLGGIALLVSSCGRKFFDILTWILVAQAVREFGFSPNRYFGLLAVGKNLGYAIGLIVATIAFRALDAEVIQIATFVPILILALIVCFFWLFPERTIDSLFNASHPIEKDNRQQTLEQSVAILADRFELTPRETEVFMLLAQGRNLSVIMTKLHVSKGTAHTHIVHVYRKLGVHKQQELIELVEQVKQPE